MRTDRPHNQYAFTILELMMVVIITSIAAGIIFPTLGALSRDTRRVATVNTIASAVAAARAYAMREVNFPPDLDPGLPGTQESIDGYSGAAVIFTPQGELRLVENNPYARTTGTWPWLLEMKKPSSIDPEWDTFSGLNGYSDIDTIEYMKIPKGYGVLGIARNAKKSGPFDTGLLLLTTPFAIRFDEYGHVITGRHTNSKDRLVYYDGDYDGNYEDSRKRATTYNVHEWDPSSDQYDDSKAGIHPTSKKNILPFDRIETAIGILIYSKHEMNKDVGADVEVPGFGTFPLPKTQLKNKSGGIAIGPVLNTIVQAWLFENGQSYYFSRTTGTIIREKADHEEIDHES